MRHLYRLGCVLCLSLLAACAKDAGTPGADAGSRGTDAGPTGIDAGSTGTDAGSTGTDASSTGTDASSTGTDAGSTGTDAGSTGTDAGPTGTDAGPTGSDAGSDPTHLLNIGDCFTFATATSTPSHSMTCGDMVALSGANVDLDSPAGPDGMGGFCDLPGTFGSLASVPTSYATCAWTQYLEGINGLANHGVIVRDAAQTHHYRMRIVSNTQPALLFSFSQID